MGLYFGTDGIRGVVNDSLTYNIAIKCGNALGASKEQPTIIIGRDTRVSGSFITSAFCVGAMKSGANIIDIGICPTAGIAYITKKVKADFGVVISASHNPSEYNGIKIFDHNGIKLGDKREEELEKKFANEFCVSAEKIGSYIQDFNLIKLYEQHLMSTTSHSLKGLTIVLDAGFGAAYRIAPNVFRKMGAKVIATHCQENGANINNNCGATCPETLVRAMKRYKADIGFSFDGDADRIMACDENSNIIDGDQIIYMLGKYLKEKGKLYKNTLVGTTHTNMGLEKALNENGINLIRTDIGDKYVIAKMEEENLSLGGEKSGHVIFKEYATTGDGILTGLQLAKMCKEKNKKISELNDATLYPQININCTVSDKMRIINSELLNRVIIKEKEFLGDGARVMVRVSGTENKIRIMCESLNKEAAYTSAKQIEKVILQINDLWR